MLEFLQQRASIPARFLAEPAPDPSQLREILQAAVAAPDHAALRPWRFIVIEGESRNKLGDVFVEATRRREPDMPADKLESQRSKPLRSPMIVTVVADITPDHPKTPETEQILSAGAAAQQLILAANALGFGAIWLTGPNAHAPEVKEALGIAEKDHIVGFVYLGTATIDKPQVRRPDPADFVSHW
ncbi:nitroreductase [Granulosicoccaceae sp. 1_MG-2023]|nr:nitroreductase [Granulosicoccaceae sp. 1_MG-2023]